MVNFLKCKTFSSCLVENKTKTSGYWAKIYIRNLCKEASNKYVNSVISELTMLGRESLFYKNGLMIENQEGILVSSGFGQCMWQLTERWKGCCLGFRLFKDSWSCFSRIYANLLYYFCLFSTKWSMCICIHVHCPGWEFSET